MQGGNCNVHPNEAVFKKSEFDPSSSDTVKGFDFEGEVTLDALVGSMLTTGFQATNVALAINEINRMIKWRLSDRPMTENEQSDPLHSDPNFRRGQKCTIFLSYTSNMISCGMRETIKFLVKNKLVDAIVTTAGGIEEDFIKCLAPSYMGDFKMKGSELRSKGVNRVGNVLIPNENYCLFEDWLTPLLHAMTDEQLADPSVRWTPSLFIHRLGREIDHEDSVYYWCYKNDIPVFCPALTDGSIGDMLYFYSYKRPELSIDLIRDIRLINDIAVRAFCTGMVILGGGVVKHHTCNANLMRNGAEYAVYINTGQEFDGSDSGASTDEAVSWGKIKETATPVKVSADATLVFPLIVSQTFLKEKVRRDAEAEDKVRRDLEAEKEAGDTSAL